MKPERNNNILAQFGRYSTVAFLLPSAMFVGYLIGYLLDWLFGTTWLKMVFFVLGVIAGFLELIREITKDDGR